MFEVSVLIEARARRREQHDFAGLRVRARPVDGALHVVRGNDRGCAFQRFADALRQEEAAPIAKLRTHMRRSGESLIHAAQRVSTISRIRVAWGGNVWQVPPGIILAQAINHATEHRAQINMIITQQGLEPPEIDGWAYVIANIAAEERGE